MAHLKYQGSVLFTIEQHQHHNNIVVKFYNIQYYLKIIFYLGLTKFI